MHECKHTKCNMYGGTSLIRSACMGSLLPVIIIIATLSGSWSSSQTGLVAKINFACMHAHSYVGSSLNKLVSSAGFWSLETGAAVHLRPTATCCTGQGNIVTSGNKWTDWVWCITSNTIMLPEIGGHDGENVLRLAAWGYMYTIPRSPNMTTDNLIRCKRYRNLTRPNTCFLSQFV
jgi:hypothetical protein